MSGLKIDTDLVNSSGNTIDSSGSNFQNEVTSFKNHVDAILSIWQGDDATEFQNVALEVGNLLDKASVTVQEVGKHLVSTANAMDATVAENKNRISGI